MNTNAADRKRVMVVDDSINAAKTMGWMFELVLGCEVQLAHNGASAIATAIKFLPHLIMLDIGMPGMTGYEVCRAMRQEPMLKDTIIVAQTGWGQKEHLQRAKEAGFDNHLVKPVTLEAIQEVLASLQSRTERPAM